MSHPTDLLLDYALAELEPNKSRELEAHLRQCESCRRELKALQGSLVSLTESLPATAAPADSWSIIQKRIHHQETFPEDDISQKLLPANIRPRRSWQAFALAASLVLALGGFFWGYQTQQHYQQVRAEQRKVAGWLSRSDVSSVQFVSDQGDRLGSVLTLSDGRALFVLRDPPAKGLVYQAWGMVNNERVSLGLSSRTLLEVPYSGYEFIGTSLEPAGGSPAPTRPLGRVAIPLEPVENKNYNDSPDYEPANGETSAPDPASSNGTEEYNYDKPAPDNSNNHDYGN